VFLEKRRGEERRWFNRQAILNNPVVLEFNIENGYKK
jgi:hypothetical protein